MPPNMNQEETTKPLEKFGTDITALAREGKLDPVIGRDTVFSLSRLFFAVKITAAIDIP